MPLFLTGTTNYDEDNLFKNILYLTIKPTFPEIPQPNYLDPKIIGFYEMCARNNRDLLDGEKTLRVQKLCPKPTAGGNNNELSVVCTAAHFRDL